MIKNYLKVAVRNLAKHKLFTALNIFGLAISMSVCLVIILLVYDQYRYDDFHPKGDRIYRVITHYVGKTGPFNEGYATSSLPIKGTLMDQYSFVENGTNLNSSLRGEIRSTHKILETRSLFADEEFFNVFGFELMEGSKKALNEPFHMVLSQEMAEKLFPGESPINQTVSFEDHGTYKIAAVVQTPPGKTHMQFEVLASFSTLDVLSSKGIVSDEFRSWENIWSNYNYLLLSKGTNPAEVEKAINSIATENLKLEEDHPGYIYALQPLSDIVPSSLLGNEISFALPWFFLAFFGLLGVVVLITATINYTNLSIAKALTRAKEIGIRKVNGATKRQIVAQLLVESVLTSGIALMIALGIYKILITEVNEMYIFQEIGISLSDQYSAYGYFGLFALALGILTGIGPGLFLSKVRTIESLKGSLSAAGARRRNLLRALTGKRTLISIQFSLSILMLVTILTLQKQANHFVDAKFGFDDKEVFYVNIYDHEPTIIKSLFIELPGVGNTTFTSHHPAVGRSHGRPAQRNMDQEPITLYHFGVDENYVDVMGLELIAGSNFPHTASSANEKFVILNQKAVQTYGFESESAAIGEVLTVAGSISLTIQGVVKDYHWEPHMRSIRPLGLRIIPDSYEYAYFRMNPSNAIEAKEKLEKAWISFDPSRPFEGGFLDEKVDEFYQFFFDLKGVLSYIATMALTITGLGFLGMVSFELKTKVKEIGIRKVLGASFRSLVLSMSGGFIIMIAITSMIAIPLAYYVNYMWVNLMAYHATLGYEIVLTTLAVIILIAAGAILSQVWVNGNKNPVDTLRTE